MLQCGEDYEVPVCGFTGLFLYRSGDGIKWEAPIAGDQAHLADLGIGEKAGRTDGAEQQQQQQRPALY